MFSSKCYTLLNFCIAISLYSIEGCTFPSCTLLKEGVYEIINEGKGIGSQKSLSFGRFTKTLQLHDKNPRVTWKVHYPNLNSNQFVIQNEWDSGYILTRHQYVAKAWNWGGHYVSLHKSDSTEWTLVPVTDRPGWFYIRAATGHRAGQYLSVVRNSAIRMVKDGEQTPWKFQHPRKSSFPPLIDTNQTAPESNITNQTLGGERNATSDNSDNNEYKPSVLEIYFRDLWQKFLLYLQKDYKLDVPEGSYELINHRPGVNNEKSLSFGRFKKLLKVQNKTPKVTWFVHYPRLPSKHFVLINEWKGAKFFTRHNYVVSTNSDWSPHAFLHEYESTLFDFVPVNGRLDHFYIQAVNGPYASKFLSVTDDETVQMVSYHKRTEWELKPVTKS